MGVVTRGMGGTGSVARAGAVSLGVARAPGVELAVELERRASFSTPARVGGRAVLGTAGGMDAAAAAGKRKALDHSSRVEKNKKTCRRASDAPQTDVADIPDDVLEVVFGHLARTSSPKEYFNAMLTSKRFRDAGMSKLALFHAGEKVLDVRAERWHEGASAFAEAAVRAGSPFATFFVGSVDFYTSNGADETSKARRKRGASLLAAAAVAGSKEAHHTLAIMHFNGSGGRRKDKDPESGAELCARGNILFGSVAAKRELGHCLQDGFGVEQDVALGRKLLAEAAKEDADGAAMDAAVMAATAAAAVVEERLRKRNDINTLHAAIAAAAEVSAAAKAAAEAHLTATPENRFLLDWYGSAGHQLAPGITSCSHPLCGRVETRRHEFRRCSCCGRVRYCSRSCQSTDWRLQHKFACLPLLELYGWVESDVESQDSGAGAGSNSGAMDAVHAADEDASVADVAEVSSAR